MAIGDGISAVVSVTSGGATTVQPPSGEEWLVRDIATGLTGGYPKGVTIGLYDGTNYAIVRTDSYGSWTRKLNLFVTHGTYLRIVDADSSADTLTYSAIITNVSGTASGRGDAQIGVVASVASGAYTTIQPSAGQSWSIQEAGSSIAAANDGGYTTPDVEITMYDGSNSVYVLQRLSQTGWQRAWLANITNTIYGRLKNTSASSANLCYAAVRMS